MLILNRGLYGFKFVLIQFYFKTSLMHVLEQDMTMYEMSPSWSRSLVNHREKKVFLGIT